MQALLVVRNELFGRAQKSCCAKARAGGGLAGDAAVPSALDAPCRKQGQASEGTCLPCGQGFPSTGEGHISFLPGAAKGHVATTCHILGDTKVPSFT